MVSFADLYWFYIGITVGLVMMFWFEGCFLLTCKDVNESRSLIYLEALNLSFRSPVVGVFEHPKIFGS